MLLVRICEGQYREALVLNITVLVMNFWGVEYGEERLLYVTVCVVRVWGGEYRE